MDELEGMTRFSSEWWLYGFKHFIAPAIVISFVIAMWIKLQRQKTEESSKDFFRLWGTYFLAFLVATVIWGLITVAWYAIRGG
jgi:hypothetical protein